MRRGIVLCRNQAPRSGHQRQYGDRPGPVQHPLPKLAGPFVEAHIRIQFIFLVEVYRR